MSIRATLKSWRGLERLRSGLGGLLLGVVGVAAAAEPVAPAKIDVTEVSLEQLMYNFEVQPVYGASKHEQRSSEAPSSVSIVDAEEIQRHGHRNLAEVLASVRGLYVSYDRNYSYLGVRGFNRPGDYTSRVLVLVNGHRVNDNVLDSVLLGNEFILDVDTIDRRRVHRAAGEAGHPDALSGHFICLTVTDTGCGMDETTRGKIFEPFFTTKEVGKGTGMGLATVYGIVKQHQGWIELDSEPGRGTTFRLFIPASVELDVRPGADTPGNPLAAIRADETILVVEDEELLLQFVQTVLDGLVNNRWSPALPV